MDDKWCAGKIYSFLMLIVNFKIILCAPVHTHTHTASSHTDNGTWMLKCLPLVLLLLHVMQKKKSGYKIQNFSVWYNIYSVDSSLLVSLSSFDTMQCTMTAIRPERSVGVHVVDIFSHTATAYSLLHDVLTREMETQNVHTVCGWTQQRSV